ncbi:MAG: hypothetical protein ACYC7H_05450, partial [Chloroflexota bacterium]
MNVARETSDDRDREQGGEGQTFHPDLASRDEIRGSHPGDRVVRISRHRYFRGVAPGVLLPKAGAGEPRGAWGRAAWRLKRMVVGQPIPSALEITERLTKVKALAVLSSDALSSVAYSTEAIMRALVLAGVAALSLTIPISLAVVLLLAIVAASMARSR